MPVQRNSRTDWRWRVVTDPQHGSQNARNAWLLTTPNELTTSGQQEYPDLIPGAHARARNFTVAINAQPWVDGITFPLRDIQAQPPLRPFDWPVPRGYARSNELLTWIQTRGPEYDDQEVKPFHQDEWPVPRGYPFPIEDRGFVTGSPLIVIATPFNQTDWPVPRGYPFPLEDRGFIHPAFPELLIAPFYQLDWPVPKGRPYPISLRWLGPQLFHYIYTRKGYGVVTDAYAYGGKVLDDFTHGGTLSDAFAHGLLLSDDFAYGGTIDDDYTHGGTATDG